MFKNGIGVIVPLFDVTLCLLMLHSLLLPFFATTHFPISLPVTSQEEDDDLLMYIVSSPAPSAPTPTPVPVKPSITQVYSRHQNPPVSSPTPTALSSDPV